MTGNSPTNDFELVTFETDLERIFAELASAPVIVTGWTSSSRPLYFHVQSVEPMTVKLTVVDGDGMSGQSGDPIEVLFSLDDGQYHWRTTIHHCLSHTWTLSRGGELSRLQRRNNFRALVPMGFKATVLIKAFKTHTVSNTHAALVDLSAGGARLRWPAALAKPSDGDSVAGTIATPGGRQIDVFGLVKSVRVDADTGEIQAGLEFQNLSGRDEQALLHLCLQLRRGLVSVLK